MKWTPARVERKIVWDDGLFTLVVRAPEVEPFEAGQFLQLGLTVDGHHVHRPYSVASPHGELLDFFIVLVEDGRLTPHLWRLEEGDNLDVSAKGAGSFSLSHAPPARTLWLIATGTGLAPYVAMLRTAVPWAEYESIVLVHGVRFTRDLAYQAEFAAHTARYGNRFHYVPVVSREQTSELGLVGRITNCIADGRLEQKVGRQLDLDSCVMLCGNPDMLDETEQLLAVRGIQRHRPKAPGHVVVERYW